MEDNCHQKMKKSIRKKNVHTEVDIKYLTKKAIITLYIHVVIKRIVYMKAKF